MSGDSLLLIQAISISETIAGKREIFCGSLGYVSCTLRPQADNTGLGTSLWEKPIAPVSREY